MALVSGSPGMSLLVRNRVGSNPTLIIILLFLCILICYANLVVGKHTIFVFHCEDLWWGSGWELRNLAEILSVQDREIRSSSLKAKSLARLFIDSMSEWEGT